MNDKLIAARPCAWCREPFTPARYRVDTQRCCSVTCGRKHSGMQRRGQVVPHLVSAVQRRAALRAAQIVGERFGMLSARERELVAFSHQRGYDQGYNAGIRPVRRSA